MLFKLRTDSCVSFILLFSPSPLSLTVPIFSFPPFFFSSLTSLALLALTMPPSISTFRGYPSPPLREVESLPQHSTGVCRHALLVQAEVVLPYAYLASAAALCHIASTSCDPLSNPVLCRRV